MWFQHFLWFPYVHLELVDVQPHAQGHFTRDLRWESLPRSEWHTNYWLELEIIEVQPFAAAFKVVKPSAAGQFPLEQRGSTGNIMRGNPLYKIICMLLQPRQ